MTFNPALFLGARLQGLADQLSISMTETLQIIGQQPMIWSVKPSQVACSVAEIGSQLGTSREGALRLVCKMPVLLTLDKRLMVLSLQGGSRVKMSTKALRATNGRM